MPGNNIRSRIVADTGTRWKHSGNSKPDATANNAAQKGAS